jgi:hypothetical protein
MVNPRHNTNESALVWPGTARRVVYFFRSSFPLYSLSLTVLLDLLDVYGLIISCSKHWTFSIYVEYVDDVNTPLLTPFLQVMGPDRCVY